MDQDLVTDRAQSQEPGTKEEWVPQWSAAGEEGNNSHYHEGGELRDGKQRRGGL
jgi:hypothetical protein